MGIYEALRSPVGKGQRRHGKKGLVPFGNRIYEGTTRGGRPEDGKSSTSVNSANRDNGRFHAAG